MGVMVLKQCDASRELTHDGTRGPITARTGWERKCGPGRRALLLSKLPRYGGPGPVPGAGWAGTQQAEGMAWPRVQPGHR